LVPDSQPTNIVKCQRNSPRRQQLQRLQRIKSVSKDCEKIPSQVNEMRKKLSYDLKSKRNKPVSCAASTRHELTPLLVSTIHDEPSAQPATMIGSDGVELPASFLQQQHKNMN
jgi:hypothetical protein